MILEASNDFPFKQPSSTLSRRHVLYLLAGIAAGFLAAPDPNRRRGAFTDNLGVDIVHEVDLGNNIKILTSRAFSKVLGNRIVRLNSDVPHADFMLTRAIRLTFLEALGRDIPNKGDDTRILSEYTDALKTKAVINIRAYKDKYYERWPYLLTMGDSNVALEQPNLQRISLEKEVQIIFGGGVGNYHAPYKDTSWRFVVDQLGTLQIWINGIRKEEIITPIIGLTLVSLIENAKTPNQSSSETYLSPEQLNRAQQFTNQFLVFPKRNEKMSLIELGTANKKVE